MTKPSGNGISTLRRRVLKAATIGAVAPTALFSAIGNAALPAEKGGGTVVLSGRVADADGMPRAAA